MGSGCRRSEHINSYAKIIPNIAQEIFADFNRNVLKLALNAMQGDIQ